MNIDDAALALEALAAIAPMLKERRKEASGSGSIPCPRCQALGRTGVIRFNFTRHTARSRRLSYTAWCETDESCIRFSGH